MKQAAKQTVPLSAGVTTLYREVRAVLEQARASAYRAVNFAMVQAYWQVGRLIVEHEQKGKSRAAYGQAVVEDLSRRLGVEFGRGFDPSNLRYMRMFFQRFANRDAARHTLPTRAIRDAVRHKSTATNEPEGLRSELSWTHYRLLLGVENRAARVPGVNYPDLSASTILSGAVGR